MEMDYDIDLEKVVAEIESLKKENPKVCLQLPDGLKPYAAEIQEQLEKSTDAKVLIWAGSCYGACDAAVEAQRLGVDLLIQWGHAEWR